MEVERGSSRWNAGPRLLVRCADDPGYWHERLVVQRVFNDGGWIIYTSRTTIAGRRPWSGKDLGTIGCLRGSLSRVTTW